MSIAEKLFANRWIAGSSSSDAIKLSKKLELVNIHSMLNFLGEDLTNVLKVNETVNEYLSLISQIKNEELTCSISIKPTQIGMLINDSELEKNYAKLAEKARRSKIFLWLDMESYLHVDKTLSLYLNNLSDKNQYTGICIQSYLKRSINDVKKIVKKEGKIRLVKGAYHEDQLVSYTRYDSTINYLKIMQYLFERSNSFMLATHDLSIINKSLWLSKKYKKNPTYAMLYGIRNKLAVKLALTNNMVLYLPYGKNWFSYSYRRLRESSNLTLVLRSLLENQRIGN